jgi:hypothetical protein
MAMDFTVVLIRQLSCQKGKGVTHYASGSRMKEKKGSVLDIDILEHFHQSCSVFGV